MSERSVEDDALTAVRAVADRWTAVLAECKASDPRWITDSGVMTLESCLRELRRAIPPETIG